MGNDRITFSLATYASDVGIASDCPRRAGKHLPDGNPNDGDITATVTFAGLDWDSKADDTSYFTAPLLITLANCVIRSKRSQHQPERC
jgi:hypothetical protein